MSRNKDETRARLVEAALQIAAAEGFPALGVNAVARQAQADKQLIYRYFGSLDGLLAAAGQAVAERLALALEAVGLPQVDTYAARMEGLALALLAVLRADPTYRQLRLMEASAPSSATEALRLARGRTLGQWMATARGDLRPPVGVDSGAANALIIAAVEGLAILGPVGLDPDQPDTPGRLDHALRAMCRGLYG